MTRGVAPPGAAGSALAKYQVRSRKTYLPPQHGAWAFLFVPLLIGFLLGAASPIGLVFAITWVCAYPVSFFGGRAFLTRLRRGAWTPRAHKDISSAIPWLLIASVGTLTLLYLRTWVLIPALFIAGLWLISLMLAKSGRERSLSNDLLLVVIAVIALPLIWAVSTNTTDLALVPPSIWLAAIVCAVYFTGSVIHVKSLIRKARDPRWHLASVVYHGIALVAMSLVTWWLLVPFGVAMVRTLVMKPGLRPATIGAVEILISVLVVSCVVAASVQVVS